jgi:hypothetical protein
LWGGYRWSNGVNQSSFGAHRHSGPKVTLNSRKPNPPADCLRAYHEFFLGRLGHISGEIRVVQHSLDSRLRRSPAKPEVKLARSSVLKRECRLTTLDDTEQAADLDSTGRPTATCETGELIMESDRTSSWSF